MRQPLQCRASGPFGALLLWLASGAHLAFAADGQLTPDIPRVRPLDRQVSMLVREAIALSPTFRSLVNAIQTSDGIVYVLEGECPKAVPACLPLQITPAGPNRVLRVVVNPRLRVSSIDMMASIGHELQHAVEVLGDDAVTHDAELYLFFRRVGYQTFRGTFETGAAIQTGHAVRNEAMRNKGRTLMVVR